METLWESGSTFARSQEGGKPASLFCSLSPAFDSLKLKRFLCILLPCCPLCSGMMEWKERRILWSHSLSSDTDVYAWNGDGSPGGSLFLCLPPPSAWDEEDVNSSGRWIIAWKTIGGRFWAPWESWASAPSVFWLLLTYCLSWCVLLWMLLKSHGHLCSWSGEASALWQGPVSGALLAPQTHLWLTCKCVGWIEPGKGW